MEDMGRLLLEKLPFFVIDAAFCIVAFWAQSRGHSVRSFEELPLSTRALNAILAYGLYFKHAVFPFGLAAYYPHPGRRLSMGQVAVAFVLLSGITVFAIWNLRRWPFVFVGWLWYLGGLFPMIGLVQLGSQQMADRYAYFPLLGLYVAIAMVGSRARARSHGAWPFAADDRGWNGRDLCRTCHCPSWLLARRSHSDASHRGGHRRQSIRPVCAGIRIFCAIADRRVDRAVSRGD